jgi:hypothetical protein
MDPADRAFLRQVTHGYRAALLASELPCAGTRVGIPQLNPADRARLAGAVRAFTDVCQGGDRSFGRYIESLEYVASSNAPRAGVVVRLELKELCTSTSRLSGGLGARMPVGLVDERAHRSWRATEGAAVGAVAWVPVGRV